MKSQRAAERRQPSVECPARHDHVRGFSNIDRDAETLHAAPYPTVQSRRQRWYSNLTSMSDVLRQRTKASECRLRRLMSSTGCGSRTRLSYPSSSCVSIRTVVLSNQCRCTEHRAVQLMRWLQLRFDGYSTTNYRLLQWVLSQNRLTTVVFVRYYVPAHRVGSIKRWCASDVGLSRTSRTDRPRKTKIGTEVAHVTHDSDTMFKVASTALTTSRG